jgi:hypothetical protein
MERKRRCNRGVVQTRSDWVLQELGFPMMTSSLNLHSSARSSILRARPAFVPSGYLLRPHRGSRLHRVGTREPGQRLDR